MAIEVEFEDNEDDTGATATITGSEDGSTNTVVVSRLRSGFVGQSWQEAGTRSGDGEVMVDVPAGLHVGMVISDDVFRSNVAGFRVTDGLGSLHKRCCVAAKDFILGLSLTGLTTVKVMKFPWRAVTEIGQAGVIISPMRERWSTPDGDTDRDDIGYPIQISFLVAKDGELIKDFDLVPTWRERFGLAVSQGGMAGLLSEIHTTELETGDIYVPEHALSNYDVGAMVINCRSQRARTLS